LSPVVPTHGPNSCGRQLLQRHQCIAADPM
jgi:hypothetical protein